MGCLIFIGRFVQKSPVISGSFAKNDLQLKASYGFSPPCTMTRARDWKYIVARDTLTCIMAMTTDTRLERRD